MCENQRRSLNAFLQTCGLPFDDGNRTIFDMMIQKPGLAENAGVLGLGDFMVLDRQLHVIADTAAESASGVFDNFEFGHESSLYLSLGYGTSNCLQIVRTR